MANKRNNAELKLKSLWDEPTLFHSFDQHDKPTVNAFKIWNWMINHPQAEIKDVPMKKWSVPVVIKNEVSTNFVKFTSKVVTRQDSARDDTVKLLIELQDGHHIETVIMKHQGRVTVCVSSQIGCKMGCKFCATGTMGIIGDLTAGEIIEQLMHASMIAKVRNVVFMGMGEPLNNFENVKLAVQFMTDPRRFGLSPRHVTVSTVGVVNSMYRLTRELPAVSLALSLHAPTQDIRLKIVPAASAHPIEKLMDAIDNHISCRVAAGGEAGNKKDAMVMIEYILIKDVNDRTEHAHQLAALLAPRREFIILNIIPYNPTEVAEDFHPPTEEQIEKFFRTCANPPYLLHTRRRREMGQDIDGACGQLAVVHRDNGSVTGGDIEDIASKKKTNTTSVKKEGKQESSCQSGCSDGKKVSPIEIIGKKNMYNVLVVLAMASFHPLCGFLFSRDGLSQQS